MSNPELKITFDLARPGSEKQCTYVRIPTEVAQILEQHLAQGMKVERVDIVSQAGLFYLALVSSCNFPKPREVEDIPCYVAYGVDDDGVVHLLLTGPKKQMETFVKNCEAYDAIAPVRPSLQTRQKIDNWTQACDLWREKHPAGIEYVRYFVRRSTEPATEPQRFSVVGIIGDPQSTRHVKDFDSEETALEFCHQCKKYNDARPVCPKFGNSKTKAAHAVAFSKWRDQHPAHGTDYVAFFVKPIDQKE